MGGIEHALTEGFQAMKALQTRVVDSACMLKDGMEIIRCPQALDMGHFRGRYPSWGMWKTAEAFKEILCAGGSP